MKRRINSLMDCYYSKPLAFDIMIIAFFCLLYNWLIRNLNFSLLNDPELIKSLTSDLLNTTISLAGFVLASLTIIVTFKDNSISKNINNETTGLELLFSSKHYFTIVKTFSTSVFLLLAGFVVLSLFKFFFKKLPPYFGDYLLIISILIIALSVFRCVLLLYKIIKLQINKKG